VPRIDPTSVPVANNIAAARVVITILRMLIFLR
jgi:hypothetical protein